MTNQASEDIDNILFEAIESAGSYDHKLTAAEADYIQEQVKEVILAIIRTEKLKLLDRLDKQIEYNKHDMGEMGEFIRTIYAHNAIEDERKQLEAEL